MHLMSADACIREIVDLHAFFEAWIRGTEDDFSRFERAVQPEITLVSPGGSVLPLESLAREILAMHATVPDFRLWVSDVKVVHDGGDAWVLTYREWQEGRDTARTGRFATAVLRAATTAPLGVAWRLVQETWLEGLGPT